MVKLVPTFNAETQVLEREVPDLFPGGTVTRAQAKTAVPPPLVEKSGARETPEDKLIELADTVLARWDGPEVPPEQSQMEDGPTELANPGTIEAASTEEMPARAPTDLSDA